MMDEVEVFIGERLHKVETRAAVCFMSWRWHSIYDEKFRELEKHLDEGWLLELISKTKK